MHLQLGQMTQAYNVLLESRKLRQDALATSDLPIICSVLTQRFDEAYAPLVQMVESGKGHEQHWLLLSLAASMKGESYSGQFEYCERILSKNFNEEWGSFFPYVRPVASDNPRSLQTVSLLALALSGVGEQQLWLNWALELDPWNVLASKQSMFLYTCDEQYSKASVLSR